VNAVSIARLLRDKGERTGWHFHSGAQAQTLPQTACREIAGLACWLTSDLWTALRDGAGVDGEREVYHLSPTRLSSRPNGLRKQAAEPGPIIAKAGRTGRMGPGSAP